MKTIPYFPIEQSDPQAPFVLIRYLNFGPVRTFHFDEPLPPDNDVLSFIWTQCNRMGETPKHWIDDKPLRSMCVGDEIYIFRPHRVEHWRVATVGFDLIGFR